MTHSHAEPIQTETPDIAAEQRERLRELFPEVFSEGRVDFEKLRATLGDLVDDGPERYRFTWAGKRDAIRLLQTPTRATLIPCREESVNFDETQHIFIEGDNLEVLKLLYKPYFGRVKMIYIDPPYNTGNDFIYRDNYTDPLETYLQISGQKDAEGNLLTSNPETSGRYHSAWLSMMYPRLFLARQLLAEEGVILISADDHEINGLRMVMNEIFGEENMLANLVWHLPSGTSAGHFTRAHEYIVAFARSKNTLPNFPSSDETAVTGRTTIRPSRLNPTSRIDFPPGLEFEGSSAIFKGILGDQEPVRIVGGAMIFENGKLRQGVTLEAAWRMRNQMISWLGGKETFDTKGQRLVRIYFNRFGIPWYEKQREFTNPKSVVQGPTTKHGTLEIEAIFGARVMPFPKPSSLLKTLISIPLKSDEKSIVMDFFAGSCPAAHAVLELNREDGGSRRFIMVQLPELTSQDSTARNAGFKTIGDIGKERIRRVIAKIKNESEGELELQDRNAQEDLGFRVFKLAESNYKQWAGVPEMEPGEYADEMALFTDPLVKDFKPENVLWEVAIKEGYGLNSSMEKLSLEQANMVYRVTDPDKGQSLLVCLDEVLNPPAVTALGLCRDDLFVCRDVALNDELAANLALQCRLKTI